MASASLLIVLRMCVSWPFRVMSICPDQELTDAASIAIWNKHRIVMAASVVLWATGVAFHIYGELFPSAFL